LTEKNDTNSFLTARQIGELSMIPFYLVGGPLVGLWMGGWLDRYFHAAPYFRGGFIVLGLMSGMRESWQVIRQISESQSKSEK
jgi:F0F1-type ATP synthase assembly protein I